MQWVKFRNADLFGCRGGLSLEETTSRMTTWSIRFYELSFIFLDRYRFSYYNFGFPDARFHEYIKFVRQWFLTSKQHNCISLNFYSIRSFPKVLVSVTADARDPSSSDDIQHPLAHLEFSQDWVVTFRLLTMVTISVVNVVLTFWTRWD